MSLSQSSFAALLTGLIALACMRWSAKWVLGTTAAVVLVGAVFVLAFPSVSGVDVSSSRSLEKTTSGRFDLVTGALDLWGDKPILGYGSGGFASAFESNSLAKESTFGSPTTTKSHTAPLTVAAEQGVVGVAAFIALLSLDSPPSTGASAVTNSGWDSSRASPSRQHSLPCSCTRSPTPHSWRTR